MGLFIKIIIFSVPVVLGIIDLIILYLIFLSYL